MTGMIDYKEVPIPNKPLKGKGRTKYDELFEGMMEKNVAVETAEDSFDSLRRAVKRFVDFRDLTGKVIVRQQMNPKTRMVTMWLEKK